MQKFIFNVAPFCTSPNGMTTYPSFLTIVPAGWSQITLQTIITTRYAMPKVPAGAVTVWLSAQEPIVGNELRISPQKAIYSGKYFDILPRSNYYRDLYSLWAHWYGDYPLAMSVRLLKEANES